MRKELVIYDNGRFMLTSKGKTYFVYRIASNNNGHLELFGFKFNNLASANRVYAKCVILN